MGNSTLSGHVNTATSDAINSANQLEASKYIGFDDTLNMKDVFGSVDGSSARKRAYEYVNSVLDRQYEMDVRKHQEDLENSAYQRAVADMKKAGLNPYWMFNNSAGQVASSDVHEAGKRTSNSKEYSNKGRDATEIFKALIKVIGTAAAMALFA